MKQSTQRILTTHVGSLPRPPDLLEMIQAKERGEPFDAAGYAAPCQTRGCRGRQAADGRRHRHYRRR